MTAWGTVFWASCVVGWLTIGTLVMLVVNQWMRRSGDVRALQDEPLLTVVLAVVFWPMVLLIAWFRISVDHLRWADEAHARHIKGLAQTEQDQGEESKTPGLDPASTDIFWRP